MNSVHQAMVQAARDAAGTKNASDLDLAIRTLLHYESRGTTIDTTNMEFWEVLRIDPEFYG